MVNKLDSGDVKLIRKVNSAAKTIRELQTENQTLKSINISLQDSLNDETEKNKETNLKLQKQNDEQLKLQRDLDSEKNKVMKFVSQNVDRDHEILKEELSAQILFCDRLAEFPNHLIDRVVDLEREQQVLETEKQKLESFIDSLPRKLKDRLR